MPNSVAPRIGYGALIFCDHGAGYVQLQRVEDIKVPSPEVAKVKVTHLLSPEYIEEFIPGLINHSDLSFTFQYDEIDYAIYVGVCYARTICHWKIQSLASEETWAFDGFIMKAETEFKTEDVVRVKMEVCMVGGAHDVYTPGS